MRRIERSTAFKRDYRRVKARTRYRALDERLVAVLKLLISPDCLSAESSSLTPPAKSAGSVISNWHKGDILIGHLQAEVA
jgi:hypothetical protein